MLKILCPDPLTVSLRGRVVAQDAVAGCRHPLRRASGVSRGAHFLTDQQVDGGGQTAAGLSARTGRTRDGSRRGQQVARLGEMGDLRQCSFCGSGQKQVNRLIAGPGVYICDSCVNLCCEILDYDGVPPPRRYNAQFDLQAVLSDWVDGINRQDALRVEVARNFLEELLSRLDPQYSSKDP